MILTGKAADYANSFEEMEREMSKAGIEYKSFDITEDNMVNLYQINQMFTRDEVFMNYICGALLIYAESLVRGNNLQLLEKMLILSEEMSK